jgi:hypothetical protein
MPILTQKKRLKILQFKINYHLKNTMKIESGAMNFFLIMQLRKMLWENKMG